MRELEIHLPQFPHDLIREPQIQIEDILAVQSLVMGYLRSRARTKRWNESERKFRLAMLDTTTDGMRNGIDDGSIDTYMACKVQKVTHDQWRMLVSFLEMYNTHQTRRMNHREVYLFDWLRNGNRQAWCTDVTRQRSDEGLIQTINATHPLSSDACLELQDRMLMISERVNPIDSNSIFVPSLPEGPR